MTYASETSVAVAKSQVEIETLVTRAGAKQFYRGTDGVHAVIGFELRDRRVQFALKLPTPQDLIPGRRYQTRLGTGEKLEQAQRARWRALFLTIKAKLVSVESGIETFEESFLGQILVPRNGKAERFATVAIGAIAEAYKGGSMPPLLGPGT